MPNAHTLVMDKQPTFPKDPDLHAVLGVSIGASRQEVDEAFVRSVEDVSAPDNVSYIAWKVLRDPFYAELYVQKRSLAYLYEAGFFIDRVSFAEVGKLEVEPGLLVTPFHKIVTNLKNLEPHQAPAVLVTTGGFSPIHHGHLAMMEVAKDEVEKAGYGVVGGYFSPSHDDYVSTKYGGEAELNSNHRIYLTQLATYDSDWLLVDPWESRYVPTDINFTDVLLRLQAYLSLHVKSAKPLELFYVFGADNAKFARTFHSTCGCVCVARGNGIARGLMNEKGIVGNKRIFFTKHVKNTDHVSSTAARKWKGSLMPDEVSNLYFRWRKNILMNTSATDRPKRLYVLRDEDGWAIEPWKKKYGPKVLRAKERFAERLKLVLHDAFLHVLAPDLPLETEIRMYHLDEQKKYVDRLKRHERILNLDICTADDLSINASRQFYTCDGQFRARVLIGRPGFPALPEQIKKIRAGEYTLVDDDLATGSTMNMLMGMLPEEVKVNKIRTLTDYSRKMYTHQNLGTFDQDPLDMVDLRDFLLGSRAGGLVVCLPNGKTARAPYMEPYVSLISRAYIPPSAEMVLSKKLWEMNEEFFTDIPLSISDLDPFAQHLFAYLHFSRRMLVKDLCRWHLEKVRS